MANFSVFLTLLRWPWVNFHWTFELYVVLKGLRSILKVHRCRPNDILTLKLTLVIRYSICKDILATQKRPLINETLFKREPLVVLSGFNDPSKKQLALVQATIQHLFPSIDIDTVCVVFGTYSKQLWE